MGEVAPLSVGRLIWIGLATRLFTDSAVQLFFPFLPVIAVGLGTTSVVVGRLVSLRSATGLLSPYFGAMADRHGYRVVMRWGLLLAAVGYAIVGLSQGIGLAAVGMVVAGLGTFAFVPTIQAYLSSILPYARRARGLGMLEFAWAFSGIAGLSLLGLLIEATNWRAPFFVLSVCLLVAAVAYGWLPTARGGQVTVSHPTAASDVDLGFFDLGGNGRSAWGTIISGGAITFGAMNLFISYGVWLEVEYGLGPAALGQVAFLLGAADLCGSVLVSLGSDRIGKRRSVLIGTALAALGFVVLPWFNSGEALVLVGLLGVRFAFEFAVVSNMALLSEQVPEARGKLFTLGAAASLIGATLAGFTGPWAYSVFGVQGLSLVSGLAMGFALLVVARTVREQLAIT